MTMTTALEAEEKGRSPYLRVDAAAPTGWSEVSGSPWHAVWTRSHFEQRVHDQLAVRGFELFLPLIGAWSTRARERRRIQVPLFTGYLFVRGALTKAAHLEVLKARGVVRVLGDGWDRPARVSAAEIEALQQIVLSGLPVAARTPIHQGDRVRIARGPLEGLEGRFVRERAGKGVFVVEIRLLQRSVVVEVDAAAVVAL